MTNWGIKEKSVRWEYAHGATEIQICDRLRVSQIWVYHALCALRAEDPNLESRHLKGRKVRAQFINNDPYFEEVNRFDLRRQTQSV